MVVREEGSSSVSPVYQSMGGAQRVRGVRTLAVSPLSVSQMCEPFRPATRENRGDPEACRRVERAKTGLENARVLVKGATKTAARGLPLQRLAGYVEKVRVCGAFPRNPLEGSFVSESNGRSSSLNLFLPFVFHEDAMPPLFVCDYGVNPKKTTHSRGTRGRCMTFVSFCLV